MIIVFLSLKINIDLSNSECTEEMQRDAAFPLDLHSLQSIRLEVSGFQRLKAQIIYSFDDQQLDYTLYYYG